jgi:hypothetical protein
MKEDKGTVLLATKEPGKLREKKRTQVIKNITPKIRRSPARNTF